MSNRSISAGFSPELTGLHTVAAGLVFVCHVLAPHTDWTPLLVRYGWVGVNIFFVLSGFLFTRLYIDDIQNGIFSLRTYLAKRIIRIYPVTTLVLIASVVGLGTAYWVDVIAHISLVHGWFPQFRSTINAPMWTLSVEEAFYLLAPVGIFLCAVLSGFIARYMHRPRVMPRVQLTLLLLGLWALSFALSRGLVLHYLEMRLQFFGTWDDEAADFLDYAHYGSGGSIRLHGLHRRSGRPCADGTAQTWNREWPHSRSCQRIDHHWHSRQGSSYATLNLVAIAIFLGFERPISKYLRHRFFQ